MSDNENWEEGTFSDELYSSTKKAIRTTHRSIKTHLLTQIINSLQTLKRIKISEFTNINLQKECLPLNKIMFIDQMTCNYIPTLRNALLFLLYLNNNIECRLMVVITTDSYNYIEVHTKYEKPKIGKYKGNIYMIDCQFNIYDVTFLFSSSSKHLKIFNNLIDTLKHHLIKLNFKLKLNFFINLESDYYMQDFTKMCKVLPKSITKVKIHPMYTVESILRPDQIVQPKRPIAGYIDGEPVFLKQNIVQLLTERQSYKQGLKIINNTPFRIVQSGTRKIKLYARWQTVKIEKRGLCLEMRNMDYFHENHVPVDCKYVKSDCAVSVCKKIGVEYRLCCVGFSGKFPVLKGVFVKDDDVEIVEMAVEEYEWWEKVENKNNEMWECMRLWRKLIKKARLYKKIADRIG